MVIGARKWEKAFGRDRTIDLTPPSAFSGGLHHQDPARKKTLTLEGPEFLRRFFLHTLPAGFTRIRELIGQSVPPPDTETAMERIERVYGVNPRQCPQCKTGRMQIVGDLPPCKGQSP